jgi:ATP-dependent Zn protease
MSAKWKPNTELDFAALHESGHAVVAAAAGCTVRQVIVTQEGELRVGFTDYRPEALQPQLALAIDIAILYAGKAAESILGGRESSRGIEQDEKEIGEQLSRLQALGSRDFTEKEILSHSEQRARELIRHNEDAVLKLAALLSQTGIVGGAQLEAILDSVKMPTS